MPYRILVYMSVAAAPTCAAAPSYLPVVIYCYTIPPLNVLPAPCACRVVTALYL